jgi:hypothetical protein
MALWAIEYNDSEHGLGNNLLGWGWFPIWKVPMKVPKSSMTAVEEE